LPDTRRHRGLHPDDPVLFAAEALPRLRAATQELCWLLGRGYAPDSALKLVGDRHGLRLRQRAAVARCACADAKALARGARMQSSEALCGEPLLVDGFNALTTLEVALSGGIVLVARDAVLRDIAGVHGSYRRVEETLPALERIAALMRELGVRDCEILLDAPVSNSGRLRGLIGELARERGWPLRARVVADPDPLLAQAAQIVATADGELLDRCGRWFNLARVCVESAVPGARIVDLSRDP
jgi:hypothetical protein